MRNDAGSRSPRVGVARGSGGSKFIPSTWRVISSYLRSVSSNAGNIAATVRTAGASIASTASQPDEEKHREQVQWAGLDILELGSAVFRHVLLLTYLNGFQVWDVEDAGNVRELVSKRDGRAAFLRLQPLPYEVEHQDGDFREVQPLLLVVTGDLTRGGPVSGAFSAGSNGTAPRAVYPHFVPTVVRFYSLRTHAYVHELRFRTGICAVRCSHRVVAVALATQIYCFDAGSLQNIFSVLTYCTPNAGLGATSIGYGALALGPRWMAYAANQPLMSSIGRVSPQHLMSPGISPSTSPASGGLVAHYAMESSKQLAAGIMTLGDMGYKTLSKYCSEFLPDGVSPVASLSSNGSSLDSEHAGTVIVRDYVSKKVVAQFRAHSSPISALCFDPSGTLLVTASVYGHNLNVFRLTPSTDTEVGLTGAHAKTSYVHLYKLCRGVTNAVIQDISFSHDSHWIAVSSSRGTSHLFAISPFGGVVGPQTHGTCSVDPFNGPTVVPTPAYPWWTSAGPLRASQQALPPPPRAVTLSVVSRIKNGFGGWRGTGRTNGCAASSGAVAAGFHDGDCRSSEQGGSGSLKDKLWVLSPSGYLIRYLLKPSTGTEAGYSTEDSSSPGQSQDLRLIVEPSEKWDVCRRVNWVEREARFENLAGQVGGTEREDSLGEQSMKSGKECMTTEELQRWYMSNAEVQICQARPLPIWAKANVYFHAMLINDNTELEIENIPHHVLEVRRKDLKPLVERLQRFDKMNSGNVALDFIAVPKTRMQGDFAAGDAQIQRSSSGSSFGSDGPLADSSSGSNGFHHNYQAVYHNSVNARMLQNSSNANPPNGLHPPAAQVVLTGSPPLLIPRGEEPLSAPRESSILSMHTAQTSHGRDLDFQPAGAFTDMQAQNAENDEAEAHSEFDVSRTLDLRDKVEEDYQGHDAWEGAMFPFCEED